MNIQCSKDPTTPPGLKYGTSLAPSGESFGPLAYLPNPRAARHPSRHQVHHACTILTLVRKSFGLAAHAHSKLFVIASSKVQAVSSSAKWLILVRASKPSRKTKWLCWKGEWLLRFTSSLITAGRRISQGRSLE